MTSNQIQVFSLTFIFNDLKSLLVLRNSCTDIYLLGLLVAKYTLNSQKIVNKIILPESFPREVNLPFTEQRLGAQVGGDQWNPIILPATNKLHNNKLL